MVVLVVFRSLILVVVVLVVVRGRGRYGGVGIAVFRDILTL